MEENELQDVQESQEPPAGIETDELIPQEDRVAGKQPVQDMNVTPPSKIAPAATVPRAKRGKEPIIISDAQLRRSARIHNNWKGYRNTACKNHGNCLGCAIDPPIISPSVVRDLGSSFYKLDPAALTDESLHSKKKMKTAISKPKGKSSKKKDGFDGANDAGPSTSKKKQ